MATWNRHGWRQRTSAVGWAKQLGAPAALCLGGFPEALEWFLLEQLGWAVATEKEEESRQAYAPSGILQSLEPVSAPLAKAAPGLEMEPVQASSAVMLGGTYTECVCSAKPSFLN